MKSDFIYSRSHEILSKLGEVLVPIWRLDCLYQEVARAHYENIVVTFVCSPRKLFIDWKRGSVSIGLVLHC